jgi:hypothetical protein
MDSKFEPMLIGNAFSRVIPYAGRMDLGETLGAITSACGRSWIGR